mmetsp:Transcript_17682/g.59628  ORF Transcript_17682/g.59628 Transcript_17682/m.59628 type:complete len:481 (-) Transcript_17682:633-2075(-)
MLIHRSILKFFVFVLGNELPREVARLRRSFFGGRERVGEVREEPDDEQTKAIKCRDVIARLHFFLANVGDARVARLLAHGRGGDARRGDGVAPDARVLRYPLTVFLWLKGNVPVRTVEAGVKAALAALAPARGVDLIRAGPRRALFALHRDGVHHALVLVPEHVAVERHGADVLVELHPDQCAARVRLHRVVPVAEPRETAHGVFVVAAEAGPGLDELLVVDVDVDRVNVGAFQLHLHHAPDVNLEEVRGHVVLWHLEEVDEFRRVEVPDRRHGEVEEDGAVHGRVHQVHGVARPVRFELHRLHRDLQRVRHDQRRHRRRVNALPLHVAVLLAPGVDVLGRAAVDGCEVGRVLAEDGRVDVGPVPVELANFCAPQQNVRARRRRHGQNAKVPRRLSDVHAVLGQKTPLARVARGAGLGARDHGQQRPPRARVHNAEPTPDVALQRNPRRHRAVDRGDDRIGHVWVGLQEGLVEVILHPLQ